MTCLRIGAVFEAVTFGALIVGLALSAGCTTDVVEFTREKLESDWDKWKCTTTRETPTRRCEVCEDPDTGETSEETCASLHCEYAPPGDAGIDCEDCYWKKDTDSDKPEKLCEICYDDKGEITSDECHKNPSSKEKCVETCMKDGYDKQTCREKCGYEDEDKPNPGDAG